MVKGIAIAVLVGLIGGDLTLDLLFPMPAPAQQTCCEGWKPCPGRKKVRANGHTFTWYCGPGNDETDATGISPSSMDASATSRRTEKRASGGRKATEGGRASD